MGTGTFIVIGIFASVAAVGWIAAHERAKKFQRAFYGLRAYYLEREAPDVLVKSGDGLYYAQWREQGKVHLGFFETQSQRQEYLSLLQDGGVHAELRECIDKLLLPDMRRLKARRGEDARKR
jgi:hypothetical protein